VPGSELNRRVPPRSRPLTSSLVLPNTLQRQYTHRHQRVTIGSMKVSRRVVCFGPIAHCKSPVPSPRNRKMGKVDTSPTQSSHRVSHNDHIPRHWQWHVTLTRCSRVWHCATVSSLLAHLVLFWDSVPGEDLDTEKPPANFAASVLMLRNMGADVGLRRGCRLIGHGFRPGEACQGGRSRGEVYHGPREV
jgi:hypothetical protein